MIEIPIDFIRPGDVIGKDQTFKRFGGGMSSSVNLMRGYRITQRVIDKLRNDFHVDFLCILETAEGNDEGEYDEGITEIERQRIVSDFHDCIGEIESNRIVDLKRLKEIVRDILDGVSTALRKNGSGLRTLSKTFYEVKSHDAYTWEHSVNSAIYAASIALTDPRVLDEAKQRTSITQFSKAEILLFNMLLHDVGKLRISINLLNKREKMTKTDIEQIKRHPYSGVVYIRKMNEELKQRALPLVPAYFMQACLHHHQSYDGSGYPGVSDGNGGLRPLAGSDIPVIGRIAAVADIYDAISSNRPYRLPYHPATSLKYLIDQKGKKLEPAIVEIFTKLIHPYPKGTTVNLTTGELAVVLGRADTRGFEPIVRPILRKVRDKGKERIIRLKNREEMTITQASRSQIVVNENLYHVEGSR
jgi:HD-GYP domain-containing protein (c-di-GMP phosphodiesterase class II)